MCGFIEPSAGISLVCGVDVHDNPDAAHMRMGVCPQDDLVWPELTGRQTLAFYGRLKLLSGPELAAAVTRALEEVDLTFAADRAVGGYSGGMRRRLCVAVAFLGDPDVVLLDEPSTGLDPASRQRLWKTILRRKRDCCILLTTHSMEVRSLGSKGRCHDAGPLSHCIPIFPAGGGLLATLPPPPSTPTHTPTRIHTYPSPLGLTHFARPSPLMAGRRRTRCATGSASFRTA